MKVWWRWREWRSWLVHEGASVLDDVDEMDFVDGAQKLD